MKKICAAVLTVLLLATRTAAAQPAAARGVVLADLGYARTADDEGFLGSGAALTLGAGFRATPRLTVQAIVERIPYYRDVEWLTFDGRVLFGGVEAAFQSSRPNVRPFVTIGVGLMNDQRIWIHKTQIGPGQSRVDARTEHEYTLTMLTSSGGLDFRVSPRASIRAGLRFHGLLDTGDDLAPHVILQPTIGASWRW